MRQRVKTENKYRGEYHAPSKLTEFAPIKMWNSPPDTYMWGSSPNGARTKDNQNKITVVSPEKSSKRSRSTYMFDDDGSDLFPTTPGSTDVAAADPTLGAVCQTIMNVKVKTY